MIKRIINKIALKRFKNKGLIIGVNSNIFGMPNMGSEPYLINIGDNVTIAKNVEFITHDGATRVFRREKNFEDVIKYGRITIKNNCFVGLNSILLPGITIGENSIVAAGSVVNKDVPPNSIVGGNPAKIISSIDKYAEKSLQMSPDYNKTAYNNNKKAELLRIFPYPKKN